MKIPYIYKSCLIVSVWLMGNAHLTTIVAQVSVKLDTTSYTSDPQIDSKLKSNVISTLERAIQEYQAYGTLFDPSTKSMSNEVQDKFLSLFDKENARLVKDFHFDTPLDEVTINDYFFEILESNAGSTGIQAELGSAVLKEITRHPQDPTQIISKIEVVRKLSNYIQDEKVGYFQSPVKRKVLISYKTPSYYSQEALIISIAWSDPQLTSPTVVPGQATPTQSISPGCKLIDDQTLLPEGRKAEDIRSIELLICAAIDEYKRFGSLLDSSTMSVTSESASRFHRLFSSGGSLHLADYREYPDNIEVATYREDVFKFFKETGIVFNLKNARIKSIQYDPDGFYYVDVTLTKSLSYYMDDQTYDIRKPSKQREYELEISYVILERLMANPLIEQAVSKSLQKPEKKKTVILFSPDVSLPLASGSSKTGYGYITENTSIGGTPGPGFQVEVMSNLLANYRAPNKPMFLSIGLGIRTFTVTAKGENINSAWNITTIDALNGTQDRTIDLITDKLPYQAITLPVGFAYRILTSSTKRFEWFISAKAVPQFILPVEGRYDAEGFYNLTYTQHGFSFYNEDRDYMLNETQQSNVDSDYGIGPFVISDNKLPGFESQLLIGYRLETSFLSSLSARFMLSGSIRFDGLLGQPLQFSSTPKDFPFENRPASGQIVSRASLLEDYYDSIKLNALGLSIGLAYRL